MSAGPPQPDDFRTVAYFSMEIALDPRMPAYSGGLGVLAGDSLRAAADLGLPMVGVTLLHRSGYFRQHLDADGHQSESTSEWSPEGLLEPLDARAWITVEERAVQLRAWRFVVDGISGHTVPVYLLDASLPENDPYDRGLTGQLYGGDARYRLCQEAVLGIGGIVMLRALGYRDLRTYHMNEGHSCLLTLALLEEQARSHSRGSVSEADIEAVRRRCVFTTHTPVDAGHDRFASSLVESVLGKERTGLLARFTHPEDDVFNFTSLAIFFCRSVNGVSRRHSEVAQRMFPEQAVNPITNGAHTPTWTSAPFARLYDKHIAGWRQDSRRLREATLIPLGEIRDAHRKAKKEVLAEVERRTGERLDPQVLTIGFARRAAGYKRPDFLFSHIDALNRLRQIVQDAGPIQVVYAGKAHPRDESGKAAIERIISVAKALDGALQIVYLEEYDMTLAKLMVAGVDLWLNNPLKPMEASGTSGMKAAFNGVPSLSVLDGWWLEGCVEGVTGWAIGDSSETPDPEGELESLYTKLHRTIVPMFYQQPDAYAEVMKSAIALNGSMFNARRMMNQYVESVYGWLWGDRPGQGNQRPD